MSDTYTVTIHSNDTQALRALTEAHPGVSTHLTHLAVLRLGLQISNQLPHLLDRELAAIQEARKLRRRARTEKRGVRG